MKHDSVCKGCFYVFAISFYTFLDQGKRAVEAHKNYRNINYKEETCLLYPS